MSLPIQSYPYPHDQLTNQPTNQLTASPKQDNYNTALQNVDILVMPTLPFAAPKHNVLDKPLDIISSTLGMTANTSPYDATGHPAISIPVGFVPAKDDASVKLPVGMMLVGRKFEEVLLLQVAGAWEKGCDWKSC